METQEWLQQLETRLNRVQTRTDFTTKGQRVVVEGSTDLEALCQKELKEEGGGWPKIKKEVAGVLAKEMAKQLELTLGQTPPQDWTLEAVNAEEEGRRTVALSLFTFYRSLSTRGCVINVLEVWKWDSDAGESNRKEGNFKLALDYGLRMLEVKAQLQEVLETEMRRYARLNVVGDYAALLEPSEGTPAPKRFLLYVEKCDTEQRNVRARRAADDAAGNAGGDKGAAKGGKAAGHEKGEKGEKGKQGDKGKGKKGGKDNKGKNKGKGKGKGKKGKPNDQA